MNPHFANPALNRTVYVQQAHCKKELWESSTGSTKTHVGKSSQIPGLMHFALCSGHLILMVIVVVVYLLVICSTMLSTSILAQTDPYILLIKISIHPLSIDLLRQIESTLCQQARGSLALTSPRS